MSDFSCSAAASVFMKQHRFQSAQVSVIPGAPNTGGEHLLVNLFNPPPMATVDLRACRRTVSRAITTLDEMIGDWNVVDSVCISIVLQDCASSPNRVYRLACDSSIAPAVAGQLLLGHPDFPNSATGQIIETSIHGVE